MTPFADPHPPAPDDDLPPDLHSMAEALDALGAADRGSAPTGMETRLVEACQSACLEVSVERLAEADRLSARPGLEDAVFASSRGELTADAPAGWWLVTAALTRRRRVLALAAALMLVATGIVAFVATRTSPAPSPRDLALGTPTGLDPLAIPAEVEESVQAMLASMDRATLVDQIDSLRRDAEGLSETLAIEPALPGALPEGAM